MSLYLKEIKKGQTFYECAYGKNLQWTALEDPRTVEDRTYLRAVRKDGVTELELMQTKGFEHYLKFYAEPEYARRNEKGRIYVETI